MAAGGLDPAMISPLRHPAAGTKFELNQLVIAALSVWGVAWLHGWSFIAGRRQSASNAQQRRPIPPQDALTNSYTGSGFIWPDALSEKKSLTRIKFERERKKPRRSTSAIIASL